MLLQFIRNRVSRDRYPPRSMHAVGLCSHHFSWHLLSSPIDKVYIIGNNETLSLRDNQPRRDNVWLTRFTIMSGFLQWEMNERIESQMSRSFKIWRWIRQAADEEPKKECLQNRIWIMIKKGNTINNIRQTVTTNTKETPLLLHLNLQSLYTIRALITKQEASECSLWIVALFSILLPLLQNPLFIMV